MLTKNISIFNEVTFKNFYPFNLRSILSYNSLTSYAEYNLCSEL